MLFIKKSHYRSGFTLVEVMVVVAIVGILGSIALPNYISWLPDYQLRSAARDVVSCLQNAKLRAVRENNTVCVLFDHQHNKYTAFVVSVTAGGSQWSLDCTETIIKQETMPEGIPIASHPSTTSYTIAFNSISLSVFGEDTVQIENSKANVKQITIKPAGIIRV